MSFRNDRYSFELASPEDSEEMLAILEEGEFEGKVSLTYTRRPDPYASFHKEGRHVDIIVSRDLREKKLTALAAVSINTMYVNGEPVDVAYLFGLRVRKEYRRRYLLFPLGFRYLFDLHKNRNVSLYVTTILEENAAAQKLLEKRRDHMPVYEYCDNYEVYTCATRKKGRISSAFRCARACVSDTEPLIEFLHSQGRRFQLYPYIEQADLEAAAWTPGIEDFHIVRDVKEEIVAAGALWDQKAYKQYVVDGYGGIFRLLYPVSFLFPMLGYPRLAPPGSILDYVCLSFWAVRDDRPECFEFFLDTISQTARPHDYFVVGVSARHPLRRVLRSRPHILYESRVYLVYEHENAPKIRTVDRTRPLYLECGRL